MPSAWPAAEIDPERAISSSTATFTRADPGADRKIEPNAQPVTAVGPVARFWFPFSHDHGTQTRQAAAINCALAWLSFDRRQKRSPGLLRRMARCVRSTRMRREACLWSVRSSRRKTWMPPEFATCRPPLASTVTARRHRDRRSARWQPIGCAMSANPWLWWSPREACWRRMPPRRSLLTSIRCLR